VSATGFYNHLDNAIANVTIGTNLRQRRNVDAIVAKGVELTGSADLGPFDLSASYAFSDSKVEAPGTALDGMRPAQSPRHSASGTIGWHAPGNARLAATVRYVGPQYEDDLQTDTMPGVATVDAYARVPIGRTLAVVGRIENLFDATVLTRK